MKVEAYYPQRLLISLVVLFCILTLGPAMGGLMDCQAQEGARRTPSRPPAQPPDQQLDTPGVTTALADVSEDYLISPGDVIEIQVDRAPELSGTRRVSASGTIRMEYLGRVKAQGVTADELASFIASGLSDRYLKKPRVTVTVKQMNSHTFFIQGAVNRPGAYQIEGRPSLLTLIAVAGGLTENYGSTAFIICEADRPKMDVPGKGDLKAALDSQQEAVTADTSPQPGDRNQAAEEPERIEWMKVNINRLFRGDLDNNVRLDPRSIVHIPQAEVFFVGGDVNAPGSFVFKEGATLRQAITLAQGMKSTAASDRAIIFREDTVSRKRQEIRVDAGKIMNGKLEDVTITANDIVIIPNSRAKSFGGAILSVLSINNALIPGR
ncbi:MAG TPA: polysaccharide biosynthesis/export family protein [Blastocatellia bacterium]|nr:polysaccharide biosynthesis/export family protein [Blastocatellia bacterium]